MISGTTLGFPIHVPNKQPGGAAYVCVNMHALGILFQFFKLPMEKHDSVFKS